MDKGYIGVQLYLVYQQPAIATHSSLSKLLDISSESSKGIGADGRVSLNQCQSVLGLRPKTSQSVSSYAYITQNAFNGIHLRIAPGFEGYIRE